VSTPRIAITAVVALALATPAAAFGQSAGDDQYQDPLAGQDQGGSGGGAGEPAPAPAPAPAPSDSTGADTSGTAPAAEGAPAGAGGAQLPRTGGEPILIGLFGVAMLVTGTGLWLLVPRREH
jgi:hypothetical protein